MSSGSYVYQWPGKSDQVFWPYIDDKWLWFNSESGFIAFGGDFEKVDPAKAGKLKAWLKDNYSQENMPKSRLDLLYWAEKVYVAREMDDAFWSFFYRLMAFETRADSSVSLGYVKKALPLLVGRLAGSHDPGQRMGTLYLLSEYNRRLGNETEAMSYLEQLAAFEAKGDLPGLKKYLLDIAKEQRELSSRGDR
jgi:hypothetical protein